MERDCRDLVLSSGNICVSEQNTASDKDQNDGFLHVINFPYY